MSWSRLAVVGSVVVLAASLAGCSASAGAAGDPCDTSSPKSLALIMGATANNPPPSLPDAATAIVTKSSASNGDVTIIVPSGTPRNVGSAPLGSTAHDASICLNDQKQAVDKIGQYVAGLKATTSEVDYLDSLDEAVRSTPDGSAIVVVGNGLQTVAPLDFSTKGTLTASSSKVADNLKSRSLLPDLDGRTVYWAGLGDTPTGGKQKALTISARSNLVSIWSAVVRASGGTFVELSGSATGTVAAGLPTVSAVPVPSETTADWSTPVVLRSGDIAFDKGTADFSDPTKARRVLGSLVRAIEDSPNVITVTGTASKDGASDNAADTALGLKRAEAVTAALVALGVPASQLKAASVGHEWCGFQPETSAAAAAANRTIVLTGRPGQSLC